MNPKNNEIHLITNKKTQRIPSLRSSFLPAAALKF